MKKCPYCGHENEDGATTCQRCYAGFPKVDETKNEQDKKPVLNKKTRR